MLSLLEGSLAFAIPEPNKLALENELSHRFVVGPRVVRNKGGRCVWRRGKAVGLAEGTLLKEGKQASFPVAVVSQARSTTGSKLLAEF